MAFDGMALFFPRGAVFILPCGAHSYRKGKVFSPHPAPSGNVIQLATQLPNKRVILSERSESKDLRTEFLLRIIDNM